ncbi:MAG: hypothetical protein ABI554_03430 [Flavobacterium sp.]
MSVQTFNYEKAIAEELQNNGALVDYYDERPSNSIFSKGIIRLKKSLLNKKINEYYERILRDIQDKEYDFLFVIKGEVVPVFFLEKFKLLNPNCYCIFYTWDSFKNYQNPKVILPFFDKSFTFDSDDAKEYNLFFRPLFYLNAYEEVRKEKHVPTKYDLLFLGTAHSDRYIISNTLSNWCLDNNLTSFAYYYMQGKLVFLFKKLFDKSFQGFDKTKISFKSLTLVDIVELYKKSNVILDIHHPEQKGLTMRTFETLGAGKKIISTNNEIKKYSFYNEKNIFLIDRNKPKINKDFFETKYEELSSEYLEAMAIKGWLTTLFVESKPDFWIKGLK